MRYREESAILARRSVAIAVTATVKPDVISNRAIDLWSLALCSFCLTVLCHSLTNLPEARTASAAAQPSTSSPGSNTTAAFKLFTLVSPRPEITSEDAKKP